MRHRWITMLIALLLIGCGSSTSVVTVVVTVPPATPAPNAAATATRTSELAQLATALAPTPIPTASGRSSAAAGTPLTSPPNTSPAAATPTSVTLKVVSQGYGQNDRDVGYAFVVENSDPKSAIDFSQYRVSAYDATGKVQRTEASYVAVVYPGQRLGIAGDLFLPQNVKVTNVDFDVSPGRARPFEGASPLTVENVLFQGDPLSGALVTGVVKSAFPQDLKNVSVAAIAYDSRGVIIGGGQKVIDRVPANGQAAAEISVIVTSPPARVEMYPTISI